MAECMSEGVGDGPKARIALLPVHAAVVAVSC
jgi:hypothetical protein